MIGIDDLLAAYLEFREKLERIPSAPIDGGPQLIIMGHGSVDDPDGTMIYEQIHDTLSTDEYSLVKGDVAVVRAPPSDSILGCILQGAWVATQLSTREGFEVKVTEASSSPARFNIAYDRPSTSAFLLSPLMRAVYRFRLNTARTAGWCPQAIRLP